MPRFRLITLGRLALVDAHGNEDPIGKRRRKLALLAILAISRRPMSRDTLVDVFWGEQPEERARHSLSDALSHLRRVLGRDAIVARQEEVALTDDANLSVDVLEIAVAAADGRHADVVACYGGPFLDGVHVSDSPRFDAWLSRERSRLERVFLASCAVACREALAANRWSDCTAVARRWLDTDLASIEAASLLLDALRAQGTLDSLREAGVEFDRLRRRLKSELQLDVDASITERAQRIATELAAVRQVAPADADEVPDERETAPGGIPAAAAPLIRSRPRSWQRMAIGVVTAGVVLASTVAVAGMRLFGRNDARAAESARQVVAIVDTRTPADSSLVWLRDGFGLMIASSLARTPTLEVVPAERVRSLDMRRDAASPSGEDADMRDVAQRLGARLTVGAALSRVEGAYVVQLAVHDASDDSRRDFTISGTSILAVADEAASRVREVADAAAPGPHLADVETANVDAFEHYVRAVQSGDEGRYVDQVRELDAALAADSGFTSALMARLRIARFYVDTLTVARLSAVYARAASRITRWDALDQAQYLAFHNGEHARAEALARSLVSAYPHDPRAYLTLANTLALHGKWTGADSVLESVLRLDSLAMAAGSGPCAPCTSYTGLVDNALILGNDAAAERAARRWLALQPDLPSAWATLATVLAFEERYDEALDAERHATQLAGDDAEYAIRIGRILVMARRLDAVDSLLRSWPRDDRAYAAGAYDLESTVERERGQFRRAEATMRRAMRGGNDAGLILVHANTLARLGDFAGAAREYESLTQHGASTEPLSPVQSLAGDRARSFAWHHALEADAIAPSGDTVRLKALADSIAQIGARSYYVRDWRLADHVRGLVALAAGRPRDAVAALTRARVGVAGWTRTNAALGEALLASGDARGAIVVLRQAYQSAPDAMGRYLPRSELDYWMARAFASARLPDSARVYARYAAGAWQAADESVISRRREMLELLRQ